MIVNKIYIAYVLSITTACNIHAQDMLSYSILRGIKVENVGGTDLDEDGEVQLLVEGVSVEAQGSHLAKVDRNLISMSLSGRGCSVLYEGNVFNTIGKLDTKRIGVFDQENKYAEFEPTVQIHLGRLEYSDFGFRLGYLDFEIGDADLGINVSKPNLFGPYVRASKFFASEDSIIAFYVENQEAWASKRRLLIFRKIEGSQRLSLIANIVGMATC